MINKTRVGKNTDSAKLAQSLIMQIRQGDDVEVAAIGQEAIFVMNKALCLVQMFAEREGLVIFFIPKMDIVIDKQMNQKNATVWVIKGMAA